MHELSDHQVSLGLLRVLAAVAWADGEVSPLESDYLQKMSGEFGLSAAEREEVMALTQTPIGIDRFEEFLDDLGRRIEHPSARERLLKLVEDLTRADQKQTDEERRYLSILRQWVRDGLDATVPLAPWRTFWRSARERAGAVVEKLAPGALASALEQTLRDRAPSSIGGTTPERRHFALLFGALIARVIEADKVIRPEELERLRQILQDGLGFPGGEVEQMIRLIDGEISREADRQRLCAEFNRMTEMDDRLRLLEALFAAAQADGVLSPAEEKEIRLISNYLWIETQEFVRVRTGALGSMRLGGGPS